MTVLPAGWERRYVAGGRLAHAVDVDLADPVARCGYGPPGGLDAWLGTGSQAEYERAASLPPCRLCFRLAARP